jgi:uncharacterized protein
MTRAAAIGLIVSMVVAVATMSLYRTTVSQEDTVIQALPTAMFGNVSLRIELATTTAAQERGLGGRESIPSGYGMLFVFPKDDSYGFWMKDTLVPLDIFWLDDKGQVISIASEVATSSYPHVFYPSAPSRYVLETAAGSARAQGIATGTALSLKNLPIVSE